MYPDVCNKYQVYEKTTRRRHSTGQLLRLGLPPFHRLWKTNKQIEDICWQELGQVGGWVTCATYAKAATRVGPFKSWLFSAFYKDTGKIFSLTVKYVQI